MHSLTTLPTGSVLDPACQRDDHSDSPRDNVNLNRTPSRLVVSNSGTPRAARPGRTPMLIGSPCYRRGQMPHALPVSGQLQIVGGGRPRPRPPPWSASRSSQPSDSSRTGGTRASRADQGVRPGSAPPIYSEIPAVGKVCGIDLAGTLGEDEASAPIAAMKKAHLIKTPTPLQRDDKGVWSLRMAHCLRDSARKGTRSMGACECLPVESESGIAPLGSDQPLYRARPSSHRGGEFTARSASQTHLASQQHHGVRIRSRIATGAPHSFGTLARFQRLDPRRLNKYACRSRFPALEGRSVFGWAVVRKSFTDGISGYCLRCYCNSPHPGHVIDYCPSEVESGVLHGAHT
jgi:hypothetical protein